MKINGFIILFASLFIFSGKIQAQVPFTFGVKAGVSLSTSSIDDYDMLVGLSSGVVMDYNFSKNIFIRTGLDFTMKGAKYDSFTETMGNDGLVRYIYDQRAVLNYLQIPIMLGYRHRVAHDTHIYISGGTYFAHGVYGKGEYTLKTIKVEGNNQTGDIVKEKFDDFDDMYLKNFDWGVVGAIGAEYGKYSINIGYEYGFTNLGKTVPVVSNYASLPRSTTTFISKEKQSWHNMNATCTLGYRF